MWVHIFIVEQSKAVITPPPVCLEFYMRQFVIYVNILHRNFLCFTPLLASHSHPTYSTPNGRRHSFRCPGPPDYVLRTGPANWRNQGATPGWGVQIKISSTGISLDRFTM